MREKPLFSFSCAFWSAIHGSRLNSRGKRFRYISTTSADDKLKVIKSIIEDHLRLFFEVSPEWGL